MIAIRGNKDITRQERIEQAAYDYGRANPNGHWNADAEYEEDYETPSQDFKARAEWSDEHSREGLWNQEKVCKYLKMVLETTDANYNGTYIRSFQFNNVDELIEDLCQSMEEQQ